MKPPHSGRPGGRPSGGDRPWGGPRPSNPAGKDRHGKDGARPDDRQRAPASAPPSRAPDRPRLEHRPAAEHRAAPQEAPEPAAPRGAVFLYGAHAVAAALANPARRLRRLLLTEEAEAALAARLPQPWPLASDRTDRAKLDRMLGRDVAHQGAALLADILPSPSLAAALERPGPVIVLDQVSDPRNVGAILRSAAAFGAAAVVTQDRNAPEETGALAKAASGALETVPMLRAVNIARTLIALKAAGCWVVGLDAAGPGPLSGGPLCARRVALVLGAEGDGLRRLTRDTCDELARLDMPGVMESLNVSAAAAVALYELRRGAAASHAIS